MICCLCLSLGLTHIHFILVPAARGASGSRGSQWLAPAAGSKRKHGSAEAAAAVAAAQAAPRRLAPAAAPAAVPAAAPAAAGGGRGLPFAMRVQDCNRGAAACRNRRAPSKPGYASPLAYIADSLLCLGCLRMFCTQGCKADHVDPATGACSAPRTSPHSREDLIPRALTLIAQAKFQGVAVPEAYRRFFREHGKADLDDLLMMDPVRVSWLAAAERERERQRLSLSFKAPVPPLNLGPSPALP